MNKILNYFGNPIINKDKYYGNSNIFKWPLYQSTVYTRTPTLYLDFKMDKNAKLKQPIPAGWNAFVYILSGNALFGK